MSYSNQLAESVRTGELQFMYVWSMFEKYRLKSISTSHSKSEPLSTVALPLIHGKGYSCLFLCLLGHIQSHSGARRTQGESICQIENQVFYFLNKNQCTCKLFKIILIFIIHYEHCSRSTKNQLQPECTDLVDPSAVPQLGVILRRLPHRLHF